MALLLRVLGLWGLADSLWLALAPVSWARFWTRWLDRAGKGGTFPRGLAALEFALSLALVLGRGCPLRRR